MKPPAIFDRGTRKRLSFLQNAYNIKYSKKANTLWTASFRLPYTDTKAMYCEPLNLVELWEVNNEGEDVVVGLFRILPQSSSMIDDQPFIEFQLEHVFGCLIDDIMFGWHELGNTSVTTNQVIQYILDRQTSVRWVMESCEYSHSFLYGWQDENLLSAMLSVPKPFLENDYIWDFDTTVFPWRLKLRKALVNPITDIRYRKNLKGFTRTEDPTKLLTRIYCYGYGDGDNKLDIKSVNNGLKYIDSPNIGIYGVIAEIWTDVQYTSAAALKAAGLAILKKLETPVVTYEYSILTYGGATFTVGDRVRIVHADYDEVMIVREFSKDDVSGDPKSGVAIFGVGTTEVGDGYSDIINRQRINETYAQGAESIYADSMSDNADATHPLTVTFNIPTNVVHVNEILLTVKMVAFRAYSKSANSGGQVVNSEDMENKGGHYHDIKVRMINSNSVDPDYFLAMTMHKNSGNLYVTHPTLTSPPQSSPETVSSEASHKHKFSIPPHGHPLEYGIYSGPTGSTMAVYLDNVLIGNYGTSVSGLNLIASMSKDANGDILRGNHTITVTPNTLTRIECSFITRLFTNSRGGNQY